MRDIETSSELLEIKRDYPKGGGVMKYITVSRALTIWEPWASAIVHGEKRVENRTWKPPRTVRGEWIAIHAGKKVDEVWELELSLRHLFNSDAVEYHLGHIIGLARVVGVRRDDNVAMFEAQRAPESLEDPWYAEGQYGWLLDEVRAVAPVPCRGKQGVWTIPDEVQRALKNVEEFIAGEVSDD